jgi:hypothetical protein
MYKIYGDYGYIAETLLEEFNDFGDAVHWVEGYVADGDFGGHTVIEIATFADDGEYVTERRWDAEDYQDETVWYEGDDDYAQDWEF